MGTNPFPGLEPYVFSETQRRGLEAVFGLALSDARLVGRSKDDILDIPGAFCRVPGVYFWVMGIGSCLYRIYVGKTKSLERRVADYMKDFQPHSPNDYKIRVFQQAAIEAEPSAHFMLYFARSSPSNYSKLETQSVRAYCPLLNHRASVAQAARDAFERAFVAFYHAGFDEALKPRHAESGAEPDSR
jgi:hypothetical protein